MLPVAQHAQSCLNPEWYGSPVLYDDSGMIVGSGSSRVVRSFPALNRFLVWL